jgi:outer membrane protein
MRFQLSKFMIMALAALLGLVPCGALAQDKLTLAQALARALEHNPELAIDAPAREAALSAVTASRASYLPRIDFEQSYTAGNNPVYVFGTLLTQRRFTAGNFSLPSLNDPNAIDNLQTRLGAQGTIWDFGRTGNQMEGAQLGVELADRSHEEHVRQVLLATLDSYYSVSLARHAREAARTSLASAESIVQQAQARVQSGMTVAADLLRGQVYLATARQQEIDARGQLEMAQANLNRLMGAALDEPMGETSALQPISLAAPDEATLVAELAQRRPDYQQLLLEVRQAELEVGTRHSDYLPVIEGFASWEMDNPSFSDYGGNNWNAGVNFRWNIFAGGADKARLAGARKRLEVKRRQLAAVTTNMTLEIHNALIQFRSAGEQVAAAQAAEDQSAEGLRILRNRYDSGLATMTDVLSAESQSAAARVMLSAAVYRYRISYARIESAAGTLSATSSAMNP